MSQKPKSESSVKSKTDALTVILMAAGKGTRMKSPLPKVLHPVAGRPMIERSIRAVQEAGATDIRLVVGHGQNLVRQVVGPLGVTCFEQKEQLGTGHAVRCAQPENLEGDILIMNGDHPLIQADDLKGFLEEFRESKLDLAVVSAVVKRPAEMGRIVRSGGQFMAIVEARDASMETLKIREINTGIYLVKADVLTDLLPQIDNKNSKGEYYLTDLVSLAIDGQMKVGAIRGSARVAHGVNTQAELALATRHVFRRKAKQLMDDGVVMIDPSSAFIEDAVKIGPGSVVYPNVFIRGGTRIGSFCVLEPNVFISDSEIADSTQIRGGTYLEQVKIGMKCSVGPYARLRPGTVIHEEAHVGNFVEMKKTDFGKRSKAGHLTYLGDAEIGEDVNIGCGTITCNYAVDKGKYKTKIGNGVFVGSDTQFVAPVTVGDKAVIGSGSTITKDVPAKALAVARGKQFVKENYVHDAPAESSADASKKD